MPYIHIQRREDFANGAAVTNAGELNYMFTLEALRYIDNHGISYSTLNDIIGALECCKQEFIRRIVNPYEDKKIKDNGDVYT